MHSVGLNYIFPYRFSYEDNSIVKIWLRSQNSGNAALGIPIIHYQSSETITKSFTSEKCW